MYCPTVAVVLSTTPTFVSAMVLGAILLQIHAPALFLCRILSTGCMAYQVSAYIPVPMSCVFWCLAWAYPCFPPKERMRKYLTYKQKTYSLDIKAKATPEKFRKWEEVMHYLNHLPEFVNEVFEKQLMENINEHICFLGFPGPLVGDSFRPLHWQGPTLKPRFPGLDANLAEYGPTGL